MGYDAKEEYAKYMEQARQAQQHEINRRIQAQSPLLGMGYGLANQQGALGQPNLQGAFAQHAAAPLTAQKEVDFNPNDHEVWVMAMSTLVNLWRSKYLDAWVLPTPGDDFWRQAYRRLAEAGKFERAPGSYIRLREDA